MKNKKSLLTLKRIISIIIIFSVFISVVYSVRWESDMKIRIEVREQLEAEDMGIYAKKLLNEIEYFPVCDDRTGKAECFFDNGYGAGRTYGGERKHEGIDIMSSYNKAGYLKIRSVSDGVVEKKGWLELGGYRLGIRGESGFYYYYAHLDSYAKGITEGKKVKAGEVIGYMGNTGYGPEGTTGKFDVHLHFGMYFNKEGEEISINPYYILLYLSERNVKRIILD